MDYVYLKQGTSVCYPNGTSQLPTRTCCIRQHVTILVAWPGMSPIWRPPVIVVGWKILFYDDFTNGKSSFVED